MGSSVHQRRTERCEEDLVCRTQGQNGYKTVDKDIAGPGGEQPPDLASFLRRAAGKQLPHLIVADEVGEVLYDGPMPPTKAGLLDLLKKYGGQ